MTLTEQPLFVDIVHLEKVPNFEKVRQLLLVNEKGNYSLEKDSSTVSFK